jgi:hypothetical protein
MKTITRSKIYLPLAAMILTAIAIPAAAQQQVPFKGALQGRDTHLAMPSPTTVVLGTSATGIGTLLGQFSLTQEITINLTNFTATGWAHWIAANGDTIYTTVVSSAVPSDIPDVLKVTEIHTVTGGTGRFAGAQGSFTVERLHIGATSVTFGSFNGTITSPGAAH